MTTVTFGLSLPAGHRRPGMQTKSGVTAGRSRVAVAMAAIAAIGLAVASSPTLAQDAVFIESASALTSFLSLQSNLPVMADRSSGTEKTDGGIIWHPALDGEKGILFASFESGQQSGWYLRRKDNTLVVERDDGTPEFAKDASFKVAFPRGGSLTIESVGRPGTFLRKHGPAVALEPSDHTAAFEEDTRYFRIPFDSR